MPTSFRCDFTQESWVAERLCWFTAAETLDSDLHKCAEQDVERRLLSDTDEYPLAVHPEEDQPVRRHGEHAHEERFQPRTEHIQETHPEVNLEAIQDELFP